MIIVSRGGSSALSRSIVILTERWKHRARGLMAFRRIELVLHAQHSECRSGEQPFSCKNPGSHSAMLKCPADWAGAGIEQGRRHLRQKSDGWFDAFLVLRRSQIVMD